MIFSDEIRILETMDHHCLIKFLGRCTRHGLPAMLFEYLPETLHSVIKANVRNPPQLWFPTVTNLIRQIVEGLSYVHEQGVSATQLDFCGACLLFQ